MANKGGQYIIDDEGNKVQVSGPGMEPVSETVSDSAESSVPEDADESETPIEKENGDEPVVSEEDSSIRY